MKSVRNGSSRSGRTGSRKSSMDHWSPGQSGHGNSGDGRAGSCDGSMDRMVGDRERKSWWY